MFQNNGYYFVLRNVIDVLDTYNVLVESREFTFLISQINHTLIRGQDVLHRQIVVFHSIRMVFVLFKSCVTLLDRLGKQTDRSNLRVKICNRIMHQNPYRQICQYKG